MVGQLPVTRLYMHNPIVETYDSAFPVIVMIKRYKIDCVILTVQLSERIILFVMLNKVVCLLAAIFILLATLCPVPYGHGPSSVVSGPRTAFRSYRAALELRSAIRASAVVLTLTSAFVFVRFLMLHLGTELRLATDDPSSIISNLRC